MHKCLKISFIRLKEHWRADPYSDPPLGLLSVLTVAQQIGHDVAFIDMAHETHIPASDIYAMSACTLDYPELIKMATYIKNLDYGGKIVVGGAHFDAFPEFYWKSEIDNLPIDIICRGEGEYTFPIAINNLDKSKIIISQSLPLLDLNTLPFPTRDVLDKEKYFRQGVALSGKTFKDGNSSTMMTSRGCPFICSFCASPILHHKKVRFRNIQNVESELNYLQEKYNVTEIRFQDDCFTINNKRFIEITDMLEHHDIRYRCSMRVDQVDDITMRLLWRGGCREMGFGIESAENSVLSLLKKNTTVELNKKALIETKQFGFRNRAFMMTGLPGETKDSAKIMIDFLEETNPDVVTLTSFMPLPGSDIYNNPDKYGVTILDTNWEKYDISLKWQSHVPFVHRISTATLDEMEYNRELLKEYLFNRGKSNVSIYNKKYKSDVV